jgi:hypothetical protein
MSVTHEIYDVVNQINNKRYFDWDEVLNLCTKYKGMDTDLDWLLEVYEYEAMRNLNVSGVNDFTTNCVPVFHRLPFKPFPWGNSTISMKTPRL